MSLLSKAFDLLRKYGDVVGFDWSKGPGPLDKIPNLGELGLTSSPILAAAQLTIKGMKQTTGSGDPEDGADFEKSAAKYTEAGDLIFDAAPLEDRWDGAASGVYRKTNEEHRGSTYGVASAEADLHRLIGQMAAQVRMTRENLDGQFGFLADVDTATSWMNVVPGGASVKAVSDLAAAAAALAVATGDLAILTAESISKAGEIKAKLPAYERASSQTLVGEATGLDLDADGVDDGLVPCGEPFGEERKTRALPGRTSPSVPFKEPEPQAPQSENPPATPYAATPG
ncbi:MAG: EspA/EspE family type VII secretion system effector [Mycolicibacterium neoaurum]|uniref:EspA/EspE family type VII secretion system effector n=1 Tax=Mycolicibacterium neoaurum TaxID=1795 RepID=UPI002FFA8CE6